MKRESRVQQRPPDSGSPLAIGAFPGGRGRDFWIRSLEAIPITGKRVHDTRLVAVLRYPLATIRQLPQAACPAHSRLHALWAHKPATPQSSDCGTKAGRARSPSRHAAGRGRPVGGHDCCYSYSITCSGCLPPHQLAVSVVA